MKKEKINSQIEIYICNHKRENGEDCFHKGGKEITDDIKKWAKANYPGQMKVYRSGCLGRCEEGIAAGLYPAKEMLLEITKEDTSEIKEILIKQF